MVTVVNKQHSMWPFPSYPPIPWDKKQEEEYNRQQREKIPNAPM
jgi:hypothetical protein